MSSDDLIEIGKRGFALPLFSVLNSIMTYVLMQLITVVGNLPEPTGSKFEMPGYATYVALFGIMIFLMTIGGYFEDFTNGVGYPKRAVIYGVCALVGLKFFWDAVGGISQGGIGQDAIISSIITIILSFGGAAVSYHYFR
ncbi:MAG: hypothetical protein O8C64_14535 [Candidatus Methanoperedens sp.]|nr:hypothetical protein [Candidatus Methanoperedens sp.]MCZ7404662.1 hypothetical protein [Candidatus Methanoperedens sp.]